MHERTLPDVLERRLSRRGLLRAGALTGAAFAAGSLLAACGGSDEDATATTGATTGGATQPSGTAPAGGTTAAGGSPATGSPATGGGTPKVGGKLSMSLADSDMTTFDPIVPTDNMSIWTMLQIYDQPIRVGPDGKSIEPGLAEKWDISDDGKTYTLHLRDVNFHDGSAVTADDVKYCLDRFVTDERSAWAWIVSSTDTVTATDPKTVTITLKSVWVPYLADISLFGASIYPKAGHEAGGDDFFQNPIGTGPFKFVKWDKGNQVVMEKNPNYWIAGQPYLDGVTFKVLPDTNARMLQFQSGELDIATNVPFSQVEALRNNSDVTLHEDDIARYDFVGINNAKFPDSKVRQAMNYAVDKDAIIKNVLFGAGEVATTYLPKMLYWNPDVQPYTRDVEKAKALMAESSMKDGFEAEFIISAGDPIDSQIAQLIIDNLKDIGGKVTLRAIEAGAFYPEYQKMEYGLGKVYYTTDIPDPDELTAFGVLSDGGTHALFTGYKNDEVDKLGDEAPTITDPDQRKQTFYQIQQIAHDDPPTILLYYPKGLTAVQKYVEDFHLLNTLNYRMWEVWRNDV